MHFPIAFIALACGLDLYQAILSRIANQGRYRIATDDELSRAAYYLQALGLLAAVPAVITGSIDTTKAAISQGIYDKHNKQIKPKFVVSALHSLATMTAILGNLAMWRMRSTVEPTFREGLSLNSLNSIHLVIEAVFCGIMFFGAAFGGDLAFKYGMGFSAQKKGNKSL